MATHSRDQRRPFGPGHEFQLKNVYVCIHAYLHTYEQKQTKNTNSDGHILTSLLIPVSCAWIHLFTFFNSFSMLVVMWLHVQTLVENHIQRLWSNARAHMYITYLIVEILCSISNMYVNHIFIYIIVYIIMRVSCYFDIFQHNVASWAAEIGRIAHGIHLFRSFADTKALNGSLLDSELHLILQ